MPAMISIAWCRPLQKRHHFLSNTIMINERQETSKESLHQGILDELNNLDNEWIDAGGILMKPSQCYRVEQGRILFNTNCPDLLRAKVEFILQKFPGNSA